MAEAQAILFGKHVLIVDDEPLLGFDLADFAERLGAAILGPCHNLTDANDCLNHHGRPADCALLDVQLDGEGIWTLADRLTLEGTPIVFVSAHCGTNMIEARYRTRPCLPKPVDYGRLEPAIGRCFPGSEGRLKS